LRGAGKSGKVTLIGFDGIDAGGFQREITKGSGTWMSKIFRDKFGRFIRSMRTYWRQALLSQPQGVVTPEIFC